MRNCEVKILFWSRVCSRVTQGTGASVSHFRELCGTTLKQAPVCLVCSAKRDGKQRLAICSHFRRSLGFLKSRLYNETALPYQRSQQCFFPSPCLLLHRSNFPSPQSLCLSAVLLILHCLLSFSLVLLFYLAASSHGNLTAHASQPMPPSGTDAVKTQLNGDRPCLTLIRHRWIGMSVFPIFEGAEQRCCGLRQNFCLHKKLLRSNGIHFFLFASHKAE